MSYYKGLINLRLLGLKAGTVTVDTSRPYGYFYPKGKSFRPRMYKRIEL